MVYLIIFFIAISLTLLLTPLAKKAAFLLNAIDKPNERKVHAGSMPRLGGLSIYIGFIVSVSVGLLIAFLLKMDFNYQHVIYIMIGSAFIFIVGVVDDIKGIAATKKLILQIIAALLPILLGVQIGFVSTPMTGIMLLGVFAIPVTLVWVVGMSNALNFIDGLDGLASGITAIASVTLFIVAIRVHQPAAAILMAALAGTTIGFMRYNFYPASIFLGDSGSLLLGYILALSSVAGVLKSTILMALLIPVFILGVPIFDAASVILRRVRDGRHIFDADRNHLHHRLLDSGFSHKEVVLAIYSVCLLLCLTTLASTFFGFSNALIIIGIALAMILTVYLIFRVKKYIRKYTVLEK